MKEKFFKENDNENKRQIQVLTSKITLCVNRKWSKQKTEVDKEKVRLNCMLPMENSLQMWYKRKDGSKTVKKTLYKWWREKSVALYIYIYIWSLLYLIIYMCVCIMINRSTHQDDLNVYAVSKQAIQYLKPSL